MLKSVLIANRGEIARRVIRTARRLGVRTVAVYSEADADAPHVAEADEAVLIGPAPAAESYLVQDRLIQAAKDTGAEAIHPGYGFLSENAGFAEKVTAAGLIWIGPPASAIRAMGLKDAAKKLMAEAGVPTTPGYLGEDQSEARLLKAAAATGYPVLIKAVAGGGGKGMRKVERPEDFAAALGAAQREAKAAFGDDRVLIEKYVTRPRHIEVQVFGDSHGNVVHLFERDCSLQRRHQKVIEEAPAPGMDEATRAAVCDAAVRAARAVDYVGAGTVEFIADASEGLRADRIWFMEMNTRLQVEHPVTEAITGQDLVEWQLRVASGEPLPRKQEDLSINGWAMEARLYAENPATGFLPSTGRLRDFRLPGDGIRVDSAVEEDGEVSTFYDPMIAKLIVHEAERIEAARVLASACASIEVWPVKTNAAFLARCLAHPAFVAGDIDTGLIEREIGELVVAQPSDHAAVAAAACLLEDSALSATKSAGADPWTAAPSGAYGFRLNRNVGTTTRVRHGEEVFEFEACVDSDWTWRLQRNGQEASVVIEVEPPESSRFGSAVINGTMRLGFTYALPPHDDDVVVFDSGLAHVFTSRAVAAHDEVSASDGAILSPMPGKIVSVAAKEGSEVAKGAPLVTLEAMKMEHALAAPFDGKVAEVKVAAGDQVSEGVMLVRLEKA